MGIEEKPKYILKQIKNKGTKNNPQAVIYVDQKFMRENGLQFGEVVKVSKYKQNG